jgi:hypothetical protein
MGLVGARGSLVGARGSLVGARGSLVVVAGSCSLEGCDFETSRGKWVLSVYLILPPALGHGYCLFHCRTE